MDHVQHTEHAQPARVDGGYVRLRPRGSYLPARVLSLEPVVLPEVPRERPRLPQGGAGRLVPQGPYDTCPGAGGRTRPSLREVRDAGDKKEPRAMVLQDYRLRRRTPGLLKGRLARASQDAAEELDRPLRRRRDRIRRIRICSYRGLYDAARHVVRGHILRSGARAPGGRE